MPNIEEAARELGQIAQANVRQYSTRAHGLEMDTANRSVLVPNSQDGNILKAIRTKLKPGLVAYIGAKRFLDKTTPKGVSEIVIGLGRTQFDIIRLARTAAGNFGLTTADVVARLKKYHKIAGIDIVRADKNTIQFELLHLPSDFDAFVSEIYEFCPDIVDQGCGTIDVLAAEIRRYSSVFLWWD